jgi:hypothetical protein
MRTSINYLVLVLLLSFSGVKVNAQVKVGSNPTLIGPNSNLEVEATNGNKTVIQKSDGNVGVGTPNPSNQLHIKSPLDPLRLEGVATGSGNETLLTIDSNGVVKKQPITIPVPTTRLTVGISAVYTATSSGNLMIVPLTNPTSSDGNFSNETHFYTAPSTGMYEIKGLFDFSTSTTTGSISISLNAVLKSPSQSLFLLNNYVTTNAQTGVGLNLKLSGSVTIKLNAGDQVGLGTISCNGCGGPSGNPYFGSPNYTSMTVVKLN